MITASDITGTYLDSMFVSIATIPRSEQGRWSPRIGMLPPRREFSCRICHDRTDDRIAHLRQAHPEVRGRDTIMRGAS